MIIPKQLQQHLRCLLLILVAAPHAVGQSKTIPAQTPNLREFFRGLVEHYNPATVPDRTTFLNVSDQIPSASPQDISDVLPSIGAAVKHADQKVKSYGALALAVISQRTDGADLLRNYTDDVIGMLNGDNKPLQRISVTILSNIAPRLPDQTSPAMLEYVSKNNTDPEIQAGVLFALIRTAPTDPRVTDITKHLLSKPLDREPKIAVLNAVGTPRMRNQDVRNLVIGELSNTDQGVRMTAIQTLRRMGPDAVLRAEPALQQLATGETQPQQVKAAAKQALATIKK